MSTISSFISAMGEPAVLYSRVLGAPRHAESGWPPVTFVADGDFFCPDFDCGDFVCTCIYIMVRELPTIVRDPPQGRITEQRARMYTTSPVVIRDRITYTEHHWEIEDVQFTHLLHSAVGYYDCTIIRLDAV